MITFEAALEALVDLGSVPRVAAHFGVPRSRISNLFRRDRLRVYLARDQHDAILMNRVYDAARLFPDYSNATLQTVLPDLCVWQVAKARRALGKSLHKGRPKGRLSSPFTDRRVALRRRDMEIVDLYRYGFSTPTLGRLYGMTHQGVSFVLRRYAEPRRPRHMLTGARDCATVRESGTPTPEEASHEVAAR